MLTASVENMLVTSIDTTLETGVVPTQYIGFRQSEVGIQRWIDVGPIVNFCLGWWTFAHLFIGYRNFKTIGNTNNLEIDFWNISLIYEKQHLFPSQVRVGITEHNK